mmetsp:Transcript_18055/g.40054  ORF Transcript_18055/g.40054 Transcript_18055/m.40054 type:complete len:180 (+) Transcript_18055:24-563(+)
MLRRPLILCVLLLVSTACTVSGFVGPSAGRSRQALKMSDGPFELSVSLPGKNELQAQMKFPAALDVPSEIVEVRYNVPFGLNVEPKNNMAVCTKDGPGGEKVGDILRYSSQWTLGLPRGGGVVDTALSFSGSVSWQVSMFDVLKASSWNEVVEALTSNTEDRTDTVVLLFERPVEEVEA